MKEMQETLADLKKQQGEEQSSPPEIGQPADKNNKS